MKYKWAKTFAWVNQWKFISAKFSRFTVVLNAFQNERLKDEQQHYIALLLKQAKEFEKTLAEEDPVHKEEVVMVMMDKWQSAREEEKGIAGTAVILFESWE